MVCGGLPGTGCGCGVVWPLRGKRAWEALNHACDTLDLASALQKPVKLLSTPTRSCYSKRTRPPPRSQPMTIDQPNPNPNAANVRRQNVRDFTVQIRHGKSDAIVGTGFIISHQGHLVTCAHVAKAAGIHPSAS